MPETRSMTKGERAAARARIAQWHERKLAALQAAVYTACQRCQAEAIDAFAVDQVIHEYHRQAQELFTFINTYFPSNARLPQLLALIDAEERGEWSWQPRPAARPAEP